MQHFARRSSTFIKRLCFSIPYGNKTIDACATVPNEGYEYGVILTHGAGGDMHHKQLFELSKYLAHNKVLTLRFTCKGLNIGYRTKVFRLVVDWLFKNDKFKLKGCFIGGRSMGSRAAVNVANESDDNTARFILGVFCLAYPLHPARQLKTLRDKPLLECRKRTLIINGTADEMCTVSIMDDVAKRNSNPSIKWLENVDHGHTPFKGFDEDSLSSCIFKTIIEFINNILGHNTNI